MQFLKPWPCRVDSVVSSLEFTASRVFFRLVLGEGLRIPYPLSGL